jgi:RecB family exonuclease
MRRLAVSPHLRCVDPGDGALAILPNRQAARSLGVPYRSLEGLATRALEEAGLQRAPELISRRLLAKAVATVGGSGDPLGLSRVIEPTLRELLRAGAGLERLRNGDNPRVVRIARIALAYRAALDRLALVDPAELLWRAADCSPAQHTLCVSGFPRLPAAERAFISAQANEGSVVHLPLADGPLFEENSEALAEFSRRGWRVDRSRKSAPGLGRLMAERLLGRAPRCAEAEAAAATSASAIAYPDLDSEVRGVLAAVKRLLAGGVPANGIALVARDEKAYGAALLPVADEYGLPLRALYQVPLTDTRLGHWTLELLTVLAEGFPFEATARLLAHPLAHSLEAADWQELRRRGASGAEAWAAVAPRVAPALVETWPKRAERRAFRDQLLLLLERLGVRGNAVRWPREALAYQALVEELRALPDADREIDAEAFRAEVAELLGLLTVPARPGRGGVELHTPLSLFGASVSHLFLLGAAEGMLPSPVRPDPLLDPFEREALREAGHAVESVSAAARREELSLWALLQAAGERLTITYPKLVGRSETLPSPYLARLGLEAQSPPPAPACSLPELRRAQLAAGENGDSVLDHARRAHAVESARESPAPHDGHDGLVEVPYQPPAHGVGVSRLIDLATCPFKFFAGTLLRLRAPEEREEELEHSRRGQLYHRVLHLAMEAARGAEDLRAAALEALEPALAATEEELELTSLASWPLERDQHLATLRGAVAAPDFVADGARVMSLETDFAARWHGIPVRGRVDRIDAGPDGLTLVDYKSGKSVSNLAKDSAGQAKLDLQLAIYREAGSELAAGKRVTETLYYSISGARRISGKEAPDEELERVAQGIRAAWSAGAYPVDPDIGGTACKICEFDSVCRNGPRLERKRSGE